MATVKVLKKFAYQLQSGSSYEDGGMFLAPFTSDTVNQKFDTIEDESIVGYAFQNTPKQGNRHTGGSISQQLDVISIEPLLEAAMGTNTSGVFTFDGTTNTKKLSCSGLDAVSNYQYANVYLKSLSLKGSSGQKWMVDYELLTVTAESRQAVGSFPSVTSPGDFLVFHEAGGTGYFRVGDQSNALDSGDNLDIDDFQLDITTGFDEQFANSQTTLTPTFGMIRPMVSGSYRVARHSDNNHLTWRDNWTDLQAELYIYLSATANIKIQIPNFKINPELTDDDITEQAVEMMIGRNGLSTNYTNAYMTFNSPLKITVVNS